MQSNEFNTDAELAVLSILLKNPDKIYDIRNLNKKMFSSESNQIIYDTITSLHLQGQTPDTSMVKMYLEAIGKFEDVGSNDYLSYLQSFEYNENNLQEFVKLVKDAYKTRQLISISTSIPNIINKTSDVDTSIGKLKGALDSLTGEFGGEGTVVIADILSNVWSEINKRIESKGISGIDTGFNNINMMTGGYQKTDLVLVAGRPGMGKTAWMCNSVLNSAKRGVKSIIFEHEMSQQMLMERFLAIECEIPIIEIRRGNLSQENLDKMSDALKLFKELPIYIDTTYGSDIDYLKMTTKKYHRMYKIDLIFVDYLQLMVERTSNMVHELGTMSRELKILATQLDITSIALSQLNRGVEYRDSKRPNLSDLRQSGNLEEDADIVAFLYRDELYDENTPNKGLMEFEIKKHRNGPLGMIPLRFEKDTNLIKDA